MRKAWESNSMNYQFKIILSFGIRAYRSSCAWVVLTLNDDREWIKNLYYSWSDPSSSSEKCSRQRRTSIWSLIISPRTFSACKTMSAEASPMHHHYRRILRSFHQFLQPSNLLSWLRTPFILEPCHSNFLATMEANHRGGSIELSNSLPTSFHLEGADFQWYL